MGNCVANCLTSTVLSILLCRHGCRISGVARSLAYFPPSPPTYKLIPTDGGKFQFQLVDPQLSAWSDARKAAEKAEVYRLRTSRNNTIPAVMFRQPGATSTILFSHSNAMDLGIVIDLMYKLSLLLKVNIFTYEYSGYGVSESKTGPSEPDTYADVSAAYNKLLELRIPPESIIVYGQSIGSGPSCYLAEKYKVRGLILHGPLASGLDVVSHPGCCRPSTIFCCCNLYPNIRRVTHVTCPTLVMHGHADEVIAFSNGKRLHEACRGSAKYPPYFVPGAGHNNLLEVNPEEFIKTLREFVAFTSQEAGQVALSVLEPPMDKENALSNPWKTKPQNRPVPEV